MHRSVSKPSTRKTTIICLLLISVITILAINADLSNQASSVSIFNKQDINTSETIDLETSYVPVNQYGHFPVGNITIRSIDELGLPLLSPNTYAGVLDKNITYTYEGFEFLGTVEIGSEDTINRIFNTGYITVEINESLKFEYWDNYTSKEIAYKSELAGGELVDLTINGTSDLENATVDSEDYYRYDFSHYYESNNHGILNLGFVTDFNVSIYDWEVYQQDEHQGNNLYEILGDTTQDLDAYYNYTFVFGSSSLNMTAKFLINPPDQSYLNEVSLNTYTGGIQDAVGEEVDSYSKYSNNSIEFTTEANGTKFSMNFKTTFTINVLEPNLPFLWKEDRLFYGRSVRKRIYEFSCIDGPSELPISNFYINDTNLPYADVTTVTSELDRALTYNDMNYTNEFDIGVGPAGTTINFTFDNDHYLVKGESDRITIKYTASHQLNMLSLDSVSFPVRGASLKLYYGNVTFGTVMSKAETMQVAPKTTDSNGQVIVSDLPYGTYTIGVYYRGNFVQNMTVITTGSLTFLNTKIPHFPTWMLIFGGISAAVLVVGLYIYRKNL